VVYNSITVHVVSILDSITVHLIGALDSVTVHVSICDSWFCPTLCFTLDTILVFVMHFVMRKKICPLQNKQVSQVWHHKHYSSIYYN
jgi:hypothetical protein